MATPQTRFVVPMPGGLKRLFSVKEGQTSGDLFINTHIRGIGDRYEDQECVINDYRHVIHRSPGSAENTIHHKTEFTNRSTRHFYIQTAAIANRRLQPIHARAVFDLAIAPPFKKLGKRDPVVEFPTYDSARCKMHYAIWVSDSDPKMLFPTNDAYSLTSVIFRHFTLWIPYCYSTPSIGRFNGIKEYVTTRTELLTDEDRRMGHRAGPTNGCSTISAEILVIEDFNNHIRAIEKKLGFKPMLAKPLLQPEEPLFFPKPIV